MEPKVVASEVRRRLEELIEWAKAEREEWSERNADRYWQMSRVVHRLESELAAVLALPEAIGGSAQGWQPPDDSDDGNFTIGGEPWTDAQLEQLRAAALSLDLKSARRLLEKHGYTVSSPPRDGGDPSSWDIHGYDPKEPKK